MKKKPEENRGTETFIVMPAYNAEKTIKQVYENIPHKYKNSVIIVDDCSKDNTITEAKKLGLTPITHKQNLGYGANQKTLYKKALAMKAKYIIMLHPDGQYDPKDLHKFIEALKQGRADLIIGSRFLQNGYKETPLYKSISLRLLAVLFNFILGINLTEVNSGYRAYTSKLLKTIPFNKNGNGYIFDPQLLIQTVYFGFKITEVPVSKKYNKEASSPNFYKSIHHGFENIKLLFEYILQKNKIKPFDFLTIDTK